MHIFPVHKDIKIAVLSAFYVAVKNLCKNWSLIGDCRYSPGSQRIINGYQLTGHEHIQLDDKKVQVLQIFKNIVRNGYFGGGCKLRIKIGYDAMIPGSP